MSVDAPDLESCAREPIHIPGSIQPHGALLVLDPGSFTVLQASKNATETLGRAVEIGRPIPAEIEAALPDFRTWLTAEDSTAARIAKPGGGSLHAIAHRADQAIILEFEILPVPDQEPMERLFPRLRSFAEKLCTAQDIKALAKLTARYLRVLTGFDRVLLYQFDRDWEGCVIGEDGNGVLPSYLDLRFPAGDIPAQARQLYKANRLRIIPDAGYRPVPIRPTDNPLTGKPIDLSFALLRSVSPVHLEYMRNMETAASMSVSIIVDGELWGLASCHSRAPHGVSPMVRTICDFAVQAYATEVAARERAAGAADRVRLAGILSHLIARMTAAPDWQNGLVQDRDDLLAQAGADGVAVVVGDECRQFGTGPNEDQIRATVAWLEARGETEAFASDNLAAHMPSAGAFAAVASGLLAVRISELDPGWLLWFRREIVSTVEWGGNPHKLVKEAGRIHPRQSFEAWSESRRRNAKPWSTAEIAAARDLRRAIISVVLRRAEERAQLTTEFLVAELSHRVKNTLATVISIARRTGKGRDTVDEYRQVLMDRLRALSDAHALVFGGNWRETKLDHVLMCSVRSLSQGGEPPVTLAGPPVKLAPKTALALSLIFHELVSNAVKHGSLSREKGRVMAEWATSPDNSDVKDIQLTWTESGGPRVTPPQRQGFGTDLIERSARFELDGEALLRYPESGFVCELRFSAPGS